MRNAKSRAHNSDCFSLIFEEIYLKHLQICLVIDGQAIVRQTPRLSQ